jgi:hypothetical protein
VTREIAVEERHWRSEGQLAGFTEPLELQREQIRQGESFGQL